MEPQSFRIILRLLANSARAMPKLSTLFDCGLTVVLTNNDTFTSTQTINDSTPTLIRAVININNVFTTFTSLVQYKARTNRNDPSLTHLHVPRPQLVHCTADYLNTCNFSGHLQLQFHPTSLSYHMGCTWVHVHIQDDLCSEYIWWE